MGRDIHISLAQHTRSADCRPPSLVSPGEEEAYAKVVTASSKVRFADLCIHIRIFLRKRWGIDFVVFRS